MKELTMKELMSYNTLIGAIAGLLYRSTGNEIFIWAIAIPTIVVTFTANFVVIFVKDKIVK